MHIETRKPKNKNKQQKKTMQIEARKPNNKTNKQQHNADSKSLVLRKQGEGDRSVLDGVALCLV